MLKGEDNTKLAHTFTATGVTVFGLSLLPANLGGVGNLCPYSTPGCRESCLNTAGRGIAPHVQEGRRLRTEWLAEHPVAFISLLHAEIASAATRYENLAVRLNVFSDIPWEDVAPVLFTDNPGVQFYDYTKWPARVPPSNYHLTMSASERTPDWKIRSWSQMGHTVAVPVFLRRSEPVPTTFLGCPTVDGDVSDDRYNDAPGSVVLLRAKGRARRDTTGFVRELA